MIRKRRVKLIWGASRVIRGRWYGGLFGWYERVPGDVHSGLAISARGVLGWGALFAALLYVAGAGALYSIWRRNPYSQLTFADAVCYPVRRAAVADKKGRAFIAEGTELFKAGKYADAANLLRLGLARHPSDRSARLLLAKFYLMANQRSLAARALEDGLGDSYPGRAYIDAVFGVWEQAEQHGDVVATARRCLAQLDAETSRADRRWLETRAFAALVADGNAQEALELADAMGPGNLASEHRVLALLALGRTSDALAALERWHGAPGADKSAVVRLRARALREANQLEEMEAALQQLQALQPSEPSAFAYGVIQRVLARRDAAAGAALSEYVFRFGGSLENLVLVAEPLAQLNNLPLLQRCVRAAEERGYALQRFHALLAQVHVAEGDWKQARARLDQFARNSGRDASPNRIWGEWMQRLVTAAESPADSAQLALLEFLRSRSWPMRMFRTTVEALRRAGRDSAASDVVAVGLRGFPENRWLLAEAEELKRTAPPVAMTTERNAAESVLAESEFFAQLEELTEAAQWGAAEQMIRQARAVRPSPAWLERREAELWLVQGRCRQARGDLAGLATATRMYLGGKEEHATRLLEVARGFDQRADRAAALTVTKEVLRRFPTFAAAQQQLAAWEPSAESPRPGAP